ncbi:MAG: HAD family hydrolase [Acidimicrobiales bacterium]
MSSPSSRTPIDDPSATDVPTVAAFDFDGTLTRGGSVFPFLLRVRGVLPVAAAVARTLPGLVRAAVAGGSSADEAKEALFTRLLSGLPVERVDAVAAAFAEEHLQRRLRPEVRDRLERHRALGHRVVIVSASPECYVQVAGRLLGAEAVLATRLRVGGGLLTGRYEGRNCRGAEKYARLAGWLRSEGLNGTGTHQPVLWVYGNSRGDLRLLSAADHGVDAGHLGRLGRLRRYPRLADPSTVPTS